METKPTKSDLEAVFNKLRAIPANKSCFDCYAKNPTWSSVTYGVFICIDCSAVHRNLGVHLTFVRSTQLDTNWTWVQLRQMQLGGNSNAQQFFAQHNCVTQDATKKYNSRAAQLYRDKLNQLAVNSVKNFPNELHINAYTEEKAEEKEADFFSEHENFPLNDAVSNDFQSVKPMESKVDEKANLDEGPKVDFSLGDSANVERKSTIGVRKIQPKKSSLGVKKGGLGATKVKTNFAEIEREAELAAESRLRIQEETAKQLALSEQEKLDRDAAVRLAYKDISSQQKKKEEELKRSDPKKAEQMERLGMGVNSRSGISHSVLTDMQTIEQENLDKSSQNTLNSLGMMRLDDIRYPFGSFSMNRNASSNSSKDFFSELSDSKNGWVVVDDDKSSSNSASKYDYEENKIEETPKVTSSNSSSSSSSNNYRKKEDLSSTSDLAQKKFGNAKGISSSQFFDDGQKDFETQATLNRFQGSSSISSADFFGTNQGKRSNNEDSLFEAPDIEDVSESVREGVTKVAGKLSSLANNVMSSLQDKYGY